MWKGEWHRICAENWMNEHTFSTEARQECERSRLRQFRQGGGGNDARASSATTGAASSDVCGTHGSEGSGETQEPADGGK